MSAGRSVLALIPARGGSKRLPRKNILPLGSLPLIAWSIRTALALPEVTQVLVSTDDEEIAAVARAHGALVPWLRPPALATDTASSNDVILHALDACEQAGPRVDRLLLLQPTSPFRRPERLREALARCEAADGAPVVAMAPAHTHPAWCFTLGPDGHPVPWSAGGLLQRSQDLPPAFVVSGNFYVIGTDRFRADRHFFGAGLQGIVQPERELQVDIDDETDFALAEVIWSRLGR